MSAAADGQLTAKDFTTEQEVRWCPGCGDYAILKSVTRMLAEVGARPERTVFVSGIGCSSRFPYYVETYGFHTIHGRAPAIATGLKLAQPDLDVWVVTGDGDGLSIGGNHLLHALRRNVGLKILLFNNEVYGLTKGQYSPTSRLGTRTPSTPGGSFDTPIVPGLFALGAGARFIARAIDVDKVGLGAVLEAAQTAARRRARPRVAWPAWLVGAVAALALAVIGIELLLQAPVERIRGEAIPVTPATEARLSDPPRVFEWPAQPGARAYRLVLRDAAAEPLWHGAWQPETRAELPPEALERLRAGATYLWTVEIEDGARRELGPFWFLLE